MQQLASREEKRREMRGKEKLTFHELTTVKLNQSMHTWIQGVGGGGKRTKCKPVTDSSEQCNYIYCFWHPKLSKFSHYLKSIRDLLILWKIDKTFAEKEIFIFFVTPRNSDFVSKENSKKPQSHNIDMCSYTILLTSAKILQEYIFLDLNWA